MPQTDLSALISAITVLDAVIQTHVKALDDPSCDRTLNLHDIASALDGVRRALPADDDDPEAVGCCSALRVSMRRIYEHNLFGEVMDYTLDPTVIAGIVKSLAALESLQARRHPNRSPIAQSAPPVICTQAAVAKWLKKSPNTSGLLETLEKRGFIEAYERRGSRYAIWFADPGIHERALQEISEGPKPRKA
jgi:hypothetical protein